MATDTIMGGNRITDDDPLQVEANANASAPVVPDDGTDLDPIPRAVHCNTAGNVVGFLVKDDPVGAPRTFAVLAGVSYPYRFRRITTATTADLVALYG